MDIKNKAAQEMVKLRWANTSKEDRIKHAQKMQRASIKAKRAKKARKNGAK